MDPLSHPSRPAGAPEFVVFSHKQNEKVSLFCRPTLWRFAEVEFDPWVSDLTVNQRFIELDKVNRPCFPRHSPSSGNSVSHTLLETAA